MDAIIDSLTNTNTQLQTEALQKLLAIAQRSDLICLKSLIENKSTLTEIYNCHSMSPENKRILADILSSIYMMNDQHVGLTYRKLGNVVEIGSFGHQFVKKVLATIKRSKTQNDVDISLIIDSLNFLFSHNCECDAVDFLIELGLIGYVNYFENERVEMYLLELAAYVELEHVLFDFYRRKKEWVKMVCLMIKMKGTYELNEIEDTDEKEMIENDLHKVDINEKDMHKRDENNNTIEANASNAVDQNNKDTNKDINKDTNKDYIGDNISVSANTSNSEDSLRRTFYANNTKKLFNVKMRKERIDHEEEVKLSYETLNKAFIYTKTDFKSDLRYILSVCNDTQFIQILFILSRCNVMVDEEMINSLGRMTEKALKVINNAMLPSINAFLHKDLQIIEPFEIGKFLKGVPKIDKDVTLKDFIPVCISNAFVHFGFAYDSLLFTKEHEYNVDLNVICEKDTPELMTVISMLGLIKRNKNENAGEYLTIYDDLLESFAFSNGFSYKKSGALLAYALSQNSYDPDHFLLPLLLEDLGSDCCMMNISSFLGIQHLYFGSAFEMTRDTIEPLLYSSKIETVGMGVFTLGSIFCGSMKGEMIDLLCSVLVERREECGSIFYLSAVLGYSLLFVGVKDRITPYEEFMKEIGVLDVVRGFAYLGTGRTDVIEELVHNYLGCEETPVENVKKGLILMSIALICLNDHTTREMAKRMLINLQSKDKSNAVPLALGLLYASDPEVEVIDALSRSINMPNPITSIVGLGIVGAGTNNTRICSLLQQQYAYFKKSKLNAMLKIAQGLVCLGKGTLTLSPLMYEKSMINVKGITNLYATCIFFLGDSYPLVEKHGFMFSMLGPAISNKFCVAMDGDLNFKSVDIRIGRPVYTNNMPGKKRGMSAVVVHESPVIVQVDEKADIYEEENGYYGYCEDVIVIKEVNNE